MKINMKSKPVSFYFDISDKQVGINILIICTAVLAANVIQKYFNNKYS